jgi:hypothetical protein
MGPRPYVFVFRDNFVFDGVMCCLVCVQTQARRNGEQRMDWCFRMIKIPKSAYLILGYYST